MTIQTHTDQMIEQRFAAEGTTAEDLLSPLVELSQESPTLIRGYGGKQGGSREDLIPYFHVCGASAKHHTLRALVVGGWTGREVTSTYVIARFLAAIEERLRLVQGIEITAYPLANLTAHRAKVGYTTDQPNTSTRLWRNSTTTHTQVLEQELWRYDYDLVILLREVALATDFHVDAWPHRREQRAVLSDSLKRFAGVSPDFSWLIHPASARAARTFTPVPDRTHQPAELVINLPGAHAATQQVTEAIGILLTLLHAARQARAEDLL